MRGTVKKAFVDTIPVLSGYLVLGFGFGIILKANGYGTILAFVMSLAIYAGAMQYVAIGLLTGGASLLTVALTTFMVNVRHLFYGISMLDKYKTVGKRKWYLIFALTDETFSLVCADGSKIEEDKKKDYYLLISVFNHIYWIAGSVIGAAVGSVIRFGTEGIDFALTALFITVFIEQWLTIKKHMPAIIGVVVSIICLIVFGSERFLIPAMLLISFLLCIQKEEMENE